MKGILVFAGRVVVPALDPGNERIVYNTVSKVFDALLIVLTPRLAYALSLKLSCSSLILLIAPNSKTKG